MAANNKASKAEKTKDTKQQNGASSEEVKKETSKAAQKAIQLQKEAKELTKAAAAAGDPDERQRLLNEALEKEVQAGSFGKTAKYLQSGTFQGTAAGGGIGVGGGIGLGVLTGSIVGGVTSLTLGGIGAGLGAGVGALHGPWFSPGKMAGNAITKLTGTKDLGWEATDEQKKSLETMIGQVNEQDAPLSDELEAMTKSDAYAGAPELDPATARDMKTVQNQKDTVNDYGSSYVPGWKYLPNMGSSNSTQAAPPKDGGGQKTQSKALGDKDATAAETSKRVNGTGAVDGKRNAKDMEGVEAPNEKTAKATKDKAAAAPKEKAASALEAPDTHTSKSHSGKHAPPEVTKPDHSASTARRRDESRSANTSNTKSEPGNADSASNQTPEARKKPRKLQSKTQTPAITGTQSQAKAIDGASPRKKPRKLEPRTQGNQAKQADATSSQLSRPKKRPRKLGATSSGSS